MKHLNHPLQSLNYLKILLLSLAMLGLMGSTAMAQGGGDAPVYEADIEHRSGGLVRQARVSQ